MALVAAGHRPGGIPSGFFNKARVLGNVSPAVAVEEAVAELEAERVGRVGGEGKGAGEHIGAAARARLGLVALLFAVSVAIGIGCFTVAVGIAHAGAARSVLLLQLQQSFDHRAWHGTNLWGSLRGLTAEEAAWRPHPGRHNVWELLVHAAYWKYRACRLISTDPPRSFDLPGSNFIARTEPYTPEEWKRDVALLVDWHRRFRAAVAALPSVRSLARTPTSGRPRRKRCSAESSWM